MFILGTSFSDFEGDESGEFTESDLTDLNMIPSDFADLNMIVFGLDRADFSFAI